MKTLEKYQEIIESKISSKYNECSTVILDLFEKYNHGNTWLCLIKVTESTIIASYDIIQRKSDTRKAVQHIVSNYGYEELDNVIDWLVNDVIPEFKMHGYAALTLDRFKYTFE